MGVQTYTDRQSASRFFALSREANHPATKERRRARSAGPPLRAYSASMDDAEDREGSGEGANGSMSAGELLRLSIAANETELVEYTGERDTGSKDRPGRAFSRVRSWAAEGSEGPVDARQPPESDQMDLSA